MLASALKELSAHNVLHAHSQENGIQTAINVFAQLQWPTGTETLVFAQLELSVLNVFHAQLQELGTTVQINVFAQAQWPSGTETLVFAQPTLSVLNAFHAQLQEPGISAQINVFAHHQPTFGMVKHVFAHQILLVHLAKPAQLQDSGTTPAINASAPRTESGTVKTVFVLQDCLDQTVLSAHLKNIGMKRLKPVFAMLHSFGVDNTASAHHQLLSSMDQNALAQLELMDLNVFHALPQDSGTTPAINASAQPKEFGTVQIVCANQDHTVQTVSNAQLKSIGMKRLKAVFAMLHSFGVDNTASAHHQLLSSMDQNALAQLELMDLNVFHALPQDSGTTPAINASAPRTESGTVKTVSVYQVSSDQIVSNAQLKSIGMKRLKPVFAILLSFGVDNIASAHQVMTWSTDNAADAQLDTHGRMVNAQTVTASTWLQFGSKIPNQAQDQPLEQPLEQPPALHTSAQLDQFGMTLQTNVFTAHFLTLPSKRMQPPENGNATVALLSSWWLTLTELRPANDKHLFDLLFLIHSLINFWIFLVMNFKFIYQFLHNFSWNHGYVIT